jgi:hypothetical protein
MKTTCPDCGREIELLPDPQDITKVQGFCNVKGVRRCVISMPWTLINVEAPKIIDYFEVMNQPEVYPARKRRSK